MKKKETPEYPSARAIATRDPFRYQRPVDPTSLRQPASPYDRALSLATVAWLSELPQEIAPLTLDRKSTRLNSSHQIISYAVFCLKKKKNKQDRQQIYIHACLL